jgi:hypothetical protein
LVSEASEEQSEINSVLEGGEGDDDEQPPAPQVYLSRNRTNFDVDDSQDEGSGNEDGPDPTLSKTSLAFLSQEKRAL